MMNRPDSAFEHPQIEISQAFAPTMRPAADNVLLGSSNGTVTSDTLFLTAEDSTHMEEADESLAADADRETASWSGDDDQSQVALYYTILYYTVYCRPCNLT